MVGLARDLRAWGCTVPEVGAVRRAQGGILPPSYELFLRLFGRDGGGLFGGTDVCFPSARELRADALDLLAENRLRHPDVDIFDLPAEAVVISMHQGYAFEFVRTDEDDPLVESWAETGEDLSRPRRVAGSIAGWVQGAARDSTGADDARVARLMTQMSRRARFRPELCPSCGSPLSWLADVVDHHGSRRERLRGVCQAEEQWFWRWADEDGARAVPLRGSA